MFHFENILVSGYGWTVAVAFWGGVILTMRCARCLHLDTQAVWHILLLALLCAFIGTRIEFVIFNLDAVMVSPVLLLYGRGISWSGLLAALIAVQVYALLLKKRGVKLPILRMLDAVSASLVLVLAVMEGAAGMALWGVWYAPAIFCLAHLLVCAGIVLYLEWRGATLIRPGEVFGVAVYILGISLLIIFEAVQRHYSLSVTEASVGEIGFSVYLEMFLILVGGALWIDWAAFSNLNQRKASDAL